jgi:hypothetical protein
MTNASPSCQTPNQPLLLSISHENQYNLHRRPSWDINTDDSNAPAGKGQDWNYTGDSATYMADYTEDQIGKVFKYGIDSNSDGSATIGLGTDTINYPGINYANGRNFQNGFMFMALSDLSLFSQPLDQDFTVEFDYRIRGLQLAAPNISGQISAQRFMIGATLNWDEASPRTNKSHFVEFNIYETPGYHNSQKAQAMPCPQDGLNYDLCYYDSSVAGTYPEGKYVPLNAFYEYQNQTLSIDAWETVHIPLSAFVRAYGWMNPPASWSNAKIAGIYIGLESQGASLEWVEIRNYTVKKGNDLLSLSQLPSTGFRVANALYWKQQSSYCGFSSLQNIESYGYTPTSATALFENAPLIMAAEIDAPYAPCP